MDGVAPLDSGAATTKALSANGPTRLIRIPTTRPHRGTSASAASGFTASWANSIRSISIPVTNNRLNRLGQTLEAALNQARSHPNSKLDHAVGAGYRLAQERYVRERGLLIALWKAAAEWAAAPHYWDESPDGLAAAAAVIEALEKLAEARWTPDGIEPEARWTLREPAPEGELKP